MSIENPDFSSITNDLQTQLKNIDDTLSKHHRPQEQEEAIKQAQKIINSTKLHEETTKIRLLLLSVVGEMLKELITIFSFFDRIKQTEKSSEPRQPTEPSIPTPTVDPKIPAESSNPTDSEDELLKSIDEINKLLDSFKGLSTSQTDNNQLVKDIVDDFKTKMSKIFESDIKDRCFSSIDATIALIQHVKNLSPPNIK